MIKKILQILFVSLIMTTMFVRCEDDALPPVNTQLVTALKTKGFAFDGNSLVIDERVKELKELDLSSTHLTQLKGLADFPKLEKLNLSDNDLEADVDYSQLPVTLKELDLSTNKLGPNFDFSKLPDSLKKINLQNNEIYEYSGLINVNFETGEMKVLRELEELNLPAKARYNMDELPFFSKKQKAMKLSMQNAKTKKAEPYTTLREVPDAALLAYIKENFSSIIVDDKIDIGKKISAEQEITGIVFWSLDEIKNLEGIQYIVNNPFYKATVFGVTAEIEKNITINYLRPCKSLEFFQLQNVNTPLIDWSNAESLHAVNIVNNQKIRTIDLNYSKLFMQRAGNIGYNQDAFSMDFIDIYKCPNLIKVGMPQSASNAISYFYLCDLPKLETFDIRKINGIARIILAKLPQIRELALSNIQNVVEMTGGVLNKKGSRISLSITEDIMQIKQVREFILHFGSKNQLSGVKDIESLFDEYGSPFSDKAYDYTKLYTSETRSSSVVSLPNRESKVLNSKELLKKFIKHNRFK